MLTNQGLRFRYPTAGDVAHASGRAALTSGSADIGATSQDFTEGPVEESLCQYVAINTQVLTKGAVPRRPVVRAPLYHHLIHVEHKR